MGLPTFQTSAPEPLPRDILRRELEDVIERALALLDAMDGDPDLEPSFGCVAWGYADECEPPEDDEPSLDWSATGAVTSFDRSPWFVDLEEDET